jgi:hypothetical protein
MNKAAGLPQQVLLSLIARRGCFAEVAAGHVDEYVFEIGIGNGDGIDLFGQSLHELRNKLGSLGVFEAYSAVDDRRSNPKLL